MERVRVGRGEDESPEQQEHTLRVERVALRLEPHVTYSLLASRTY